MSTVIGNLHAVLGLDSSTFQKGLNDSTSGLKKIGGATTDVQRSMNSFQATLRGIGAAFGALGLAMSVRGLANMADGWSDLQSRVGLAVGDMDKAGSVMQRLSDIADRTYSSLNQTAEGFLQNATTLRDLGLSTAQALDYTEALNNAMVVSGAKGDQATRVQSALSNAMALGALRGDNLNTILTAGGRVAELLAEEMGVTTLELRKLGQQGKLTGDVILRALIGNMELLRDEAEEMPATIGDAFVRIGNAMLRLVGSFDQFFGASETVAGVLIKLSENLARLMSYVAAAVIGFGTHYVAALVRARIANMSFVASLAMLRTALMRTGIGAIVVLAGELIYQFGRLVAMTGSFGNALRALGELGRLVWQGLIDSAKAIPPGLQWVWNTIKADFYRLVGDLQHAWYMFLGSMSVAAREAGFDGVAESLRGSAAEAGRAWDEIFAKEQEALGAAKNNAEEVTGILKDAFAPVAEAWGNLKKISDDAADDMSSALPEGLGGSDDKKGSKGKKGTTERPFFEGIQADMVNLQRQMQLIGKTREEAAALQARWQLLDEAKRRGIPINEKLMTQIDAHADQLGRLTGELERAEIAQQQFDQAVEGLADAFAGALVAGESLREGLGQVFKQIASDILKSGIRNALTSQFSGGGGFLSNLFGGFRLPAFASGGSHQGGFRIVGEHGPELEATGAARYYSAGQTRSILGGVGDREQVVHIAVEAVPNPYFDTRVMQLATAGDMRTAQAARQAMPGQIRDMQMRGTK